MVMDMFPTTFLWKNILFLRLILLYFFRRKQNLNFCQDLRMRIKSKNCYLFLKFDNFPRNKAAWLKYLRTMKVSDQQTVVPTQVLLSHFLFDENVNFFMDIMLRNVQKKFLNIFT